MFNRKFFILVFFILSINHSDAQILGIGTTSPNTSSILDLGDTTRGFIVPRMTNAQRGTISNPATGLLIYQTNSTPGFYYNSGTPGSPVWTYMLTPSFWGDPPRIGWWGPSGNYIISNTELSWDTVNIRLGIGTIAPTSKLHIIGTSDNVLVKAAAFTTQTTDIMKISDGNTGARFFTFDNAGRMIVRGTGTTTSNNVFHLSAYNGAPTPSIGSSFFEIDLDNITGSELVTRLSQSDATNTPDLWLYMSHGNVTTPSNLNNGDYISFFFDAGRYNSVWGYLTNIISYYRGSGTTQIADMTFHTLTGGAASYTGERMRITPSGEVGINATAFTAGNLEKLEVNSGTTTVNNTSISSNIDDMLKAYIQNLSSGTNASSDIVATADNGSETTNYIDLGTNSSGYANAAYSITDADDGYLYNIGNNLVIGTGPSSTTKAIKFFTGGTLNTNEALRITGSGKIGIGTTAPNASSIVDISSTTEGFLVPRMTSAERASIATPATGLLVYQTNGSSGFYYAQGGWTAISSSSTTYAAGDGLTLSGRTFILNTPITVDSGGTGTTTFNSGEVLLGLGISSPTSSADLYWDNTNSHARLGIGTTAPSDTLDVNGDAQFGINGTTITNIIKASVNKDVASIAANSSRLEYYSVTNANTASRVIVSPNAALPNGIIIAYARVSAAGTIEIMFRNTTGGAIDPAAMNYYITLIQ
jgi:hypothetical protein